MIITPFADERPRLSNTLWCDGVTIRHLPDFATLLDIHAHYSAERAPLRALVSLDDLVQARYTRYHTTEKHQLRDWDAEAETDVAEPLPPGDRAALHTCLSRISEAAANLSFDALRGQMFWAGEDAEDTVLRANIQPESQLYLEQEGAFILQLVPVDSAADMIAAFPNGYFAGDFSPMQNWVLARHMEQTHGLALFGLGASYLGFRAEQPFTPQTAMAAAQDAVALYHDAPAEAAAQIAALLEQRPWLLLRYTE